MRSHTIIKSAIDTLENSLMKILDVIQIGCALEYPSDFFISNDSQQLAAASHMGLEIKGVRPGEHFLQKS
jgi:hypothetical protein